MITARFAYLPYDLALAFSEYIILIGFCIYLRYKYNQKHEFHYESVYKTTIGKSLLSESILLMIRFLLFLFFIIFSSILHYTNTPDGYKYYTYWYVSYFI